MCSERNCIRLSFVLCEHLFLESVSATLGTGIHAFFENMLGSFRNSQGLIQLKCHNKDYRFCDSMRTNGCLHDTCKQGQNSFTNTGCHTEDNEHHLSTLILWSRSAFYIFQIFVMTTSSVAYKLQTAFETKRDNRTPPLLLDRGSLLKLRQPWAWKAVLLYNLNVMMAQSTPLHRRCLQGGDCAHVEERKKSCSILLILIPALRQGLHRARAKESTRLTPMRVRENSDPPHHWPMPTNVEAQSRNAFIPPKRARRPKRQPRNLTTKAMKLLQKTIQLSKQAACARVLRARLARSERSGSERRMESSTMPI